MVSENTTIAAISTPPGAGGIGIIRMSGPLALKILERIFRPASSSCPLDSHYLYYGRITSPDNDQILDEVLAVFMLAPRTYTREDVVEIHCHGSFLVLQSILDVILAQGAELAQPGEFTKRAFLNGRIDLTRAEAVVDILAARTRKGVDLAVEQMGGALYEKVDLLRSRLLAIRALLEVAIDFPEDEVEIVDHSSLLMQLETEVIDPLAALIESADSGRIVREGVSVVIVGLPNVGKSSLLNALLQEDRALVTPVPGTTRDTIEEYLDINGVPVRVIDTAGIHNDAELVEQLGIDRARDSINRSDLVIFVVDGSTPLTDNDRELFATVSHKPLLTVINKCDLTKRIDEAADPEICMSAINISALNQEGFNDLKQEIFNRITGGREQWQEEGCTPNLRHKVAMERALVSLRIVKNGLAHGIANDLIAIDLLDSLDFLGQIVGETTTEDMLDLIFEQFCLGK